MNYSETTVNGYKSYLKKVWAHSTQTGDSYTLKTSQLFGDEIALGLSLSENSRKHIRTSIRRFNDYLPNSPMHFGKTAVAKSLLRFFEQF